jgi:ATP-binding cassette, subfamily C (CFTR/MRP), member 1
MRHRLTYFAVHFLDLADKVLLVKSSGTVASLPKEHIHTAITSAVKPAQQAAEPVASESASSREPSTAILLAEGKSDISRKSGDWSVYSFYARATGYWNAAIFLLCCAACAFCFQFSIVWVQRWSDASSLSDSAASTSFYLGIYALLCVSAFIALGAASWSMIVAMVSQSAATLHTTIMRAFFAAPASFFSHVDDGVTFNRFNQDLQLIDYDLPLAGVNTFLFAAICFAQAIVISVSTTFMAVGIAASILVIFLVQKFYLKTSRQLRLLDIEAKAPLFTNFKETLTGLPTIRAFGSRLSSYLQDKQNHALDRSQQPIYLLYTVQRWLGLVLDLLVAGLAVVLITIIVEVNLGVSGSDMGVALVSLTSFNQYLTYLVRYWASMETSLGAIARVRDFSTKTPSALGSGCSGERDALSRLSGEIFFDQVSATHTEQGQNPGPNIGATNGPIAARVLSSVTLKVPSGSKLAITGRSGSGKSTLLSTLCRTLPVSSGTITIGGLDISTIDQEVVQQRIVSAPQSPFFFPGLSLKENLTAVGGEVEDSVELIRSVTGELGIWESIKARGGVESAFQPSSWSSGERQLLSLARAILKGRRIRNDPQCGWKILVLDEATSR